MYRINIKIVFLILIYVFTIGTSKNCYWNSECVYKYFSSKTPYNSVRGDIRDSKVKLKGCEPVSIWTLIRHGKRYPGIDYQRIMLQALAIRDYVVQSYLTGNSSLCAQDVENLRNWEVDTKLFENTHSLTDEGYQEILEIGCRLKEAYSELLSDLEDGSYSLRSAFGHWVEDGVDGFVKGVANRSLFVEKPDRHYDIMAPYEACPKYVLGVRNNPKTYNEAEKYENSPEYIATKQRIQNRLGIQYVLTNKNITALYDLCRYTWPATGNKGSPWCALFTKEDLHPIEYYSDLRHYYRNGYGTPINEKFGQIPMADLYKTFVNAKANSNRKLTSYFTHATMMDMVYSALGLFKDKVPLTSVHRDPDRKWRSTTMAPCAANIIAVLNRCSTHNKEDYKIVFYSNEEPLTSMCDNGVCSWQKFENKFKEYLNTTIDFCFT
ncbi:multiple inositol polyphosphate phosphatase 1-like [Maniola hyperantus]|uniref:multiple inositol polyphosphate phosphatase 1-like n=1 Tax=Aphantopus hyperantus TaxID=2795564 RepID=UPI0015693E85|nr:multiple inositol polyphosphate phosphatase 1-like [Maniola hyperantus]